MFSSIVTMSDFKPTDGQSLIEGNTYEEVGADGEIKHGTLGQSAWTNRIRSFAKMLSITFQDLRNDSLNFLANADKLLGRGAARAILKEWFKEFMDNSAFFTSGRGNYASGAGTALSCHQPGDRRGSVQGPDDGGRVTTSTSTRRSCSRRWRST
jgi:hypothetical protein